MPTFDTCQTGMTTDTKFVDRLKEHEFFIGGMGVMTGDTALPEDNSMNIGHRLVFVQKVLFIIVTGDTNHGGTFGPELIPIFPSMGVMAQGATADQGPMSMFAGQQGFLCGMTGKTGVIDSALAKTDSPGLNILLVTAKALLIDRGAVLPFVLADDILMACGTGGLLLEVNQADGFCLQQLMAIDAALGQLAVLVKKVKRFYIHGQEGLQGLIR